MTLEKGTPVRWHIVEGDDNRRETIIRMWRDFRSFAQYPSMWAPVESWLEAQAQMMGQPIPKSLEPEPQRPGAPIGASFRWMELVDIPKWFREELGIGTTTDYFGQRQRALRSKRLKHLALAAQAQIEEDRRELLSRTVKT